MKTDERPERITVRHRLVALGDAILALLLSLLAVDLVLPRRVGSGGCEAPEERADATGVAAEM